MSDDWKLVYRGLEPEKEGLREALCTLGNGIFASRGAAEECFSDAIHYPGTYVAGGYNELASEVAGRRVINEDLVNFPNWLWLRVRPVEGAWISPWIQEVKDFEQILDLRAAILTRRFRVVDGRGRITEVVSRRLVHMGRPHLAAIQWQVRALNWTGRVEIESGIDGAVINDNVARYRQLRSRHLQVCHRGAVAPEGIEMQVRTSQSHIELAQAARTRVFGAAQGSEHRRVARGDEQRIHEVIQADLGADKPLIIDKVVAQVTSGDRGVGQVGRAARMVVNGAPNVEELIASHRQAWERLWRRCDVTVTLADGAAASQRDQLILRLHIFHLLQTASPNTVGRDVGIPARGLHGEAYRGHIFWDELFILPFFTLRLPSVTRSTILYRYHRLEAARQIAARDGHEGACFPWQSGTDGREVTQEVHLNPMSGAWDPDHSHLQRHINAAIVYSIWHYWQVTGDRAFMAEYGAEIVLEIARYWASLAAYDEGDDRYDIRRVMGPDEYHEKYPGAAEGGVDNNVYTNLCALWCLLRARDCLDLVGQEQARQLRQKIGIDDADLQRWEHISRRMRVVFHDGVLSQFEGYQKLAEFDWAGYQDRYGNIERLDRILKAEGDSPDHYKVSKQADVIMLLYLFRPHQLEALLHRLGYDFDAAADVPKNVDYYRARTSHGSTLSRVVYTSVVHRQDSEEGARLFVSALESDVCDVQGGTTQEGIHLGAMAGTVDIVKRHYAGLDVEGQKLDFWPALPQRFERIAFSCLVGGRWYDVAVTHDRLKVAVDDVVAEPVTLWVEGQAFGLAPGASLEVALSGRHRTEFLAANGEQALAPPIRLVSKDERHWPPGGCG